MTGRFLKAGRARPLTCAGQVLITFVILMPVLLVVLGVIFRSSRILLAHHQIQNHCNKVVLDALSIQAQGITALAKINPWAKRVIDFRRDLDHFLEAGGLLIPVLDVEAVDAREALEGIQSFIQTTQDGITEAELARSFLILSKPAGANYGGEISQSFGPKNMLMPHRFKSALKLHVTKQTGYESETGAPLQLDKDFAKRQIATGRIQVQTETFLKAQKWRKTDTGRPAWSWLDFESLPPMLIQCKARVDMEQMEGKWTVRLAPVADKL